MKMKSENLYDVKEKSYFSQNRLEMLQFIPPTATRLLEVGCGRGGFIGALKRQRDVFAVGIEPFEAAAEEARQHFDRLHTTSFEEALNALKGEQFDCIVFNDVLEHLLNPWELLHAIRSNLAPGGCIVASIPNIRYWPILRDLMVSGNWIYSDHGVLDRTHLRFFTHKSMKKMFEQAGYDVVSLTGINPIRFTWKQELLNKILSGLLHDTRFMQYACVSKLSS
ncbi:MAG: class I SAM-dependent methyltransferase [Cytophaga sp.]|nr:class I SAM-dependent methyltransferase [Undibacterium sp.]